MYFTYCRFHFHFNKLFRLHFSYISTYIEKNSLQKFSLPSECNLQKSPLASTIGKQSMKSLLRSLLAILFIVGLIYGVKVYSGQLKDFIVSRVPMTAKVLGESTVNKTTTDIKKQLTNDAQKQLEQVKEKGMNTKVSDLVNSVSLLQKLTQNIHGLQSQINDKLKELSKK